MITYADEQGWQFVPQPSASPSTSAGADNSATMNGLIAATTISIFAVVILAIVVARLRSQLKTAQNHLLHRKSPFELSVRGGVGSVEPSPSIYALSGVDQRSIVVDYGFNKSSRHGEPSSQRVGAAGNVVLSHQKPNWDEQGNTLLAGVSPASADTSRRGDSTTNGGLHEGYVESDNPLARAVLAAGASGS